MNIQKLRVTPHEYTKEYLLDIARASKLDVSFTEKKEMIIQKLKDRGVVFPRSRVVIPPPKVSPYNEFMRQQIHKINEKTQHTLPPQEVFKKAAHAYQVQKKRRHAF